MYANRKSRASFNPYPQVKYLKKKLKKLNESARHVNAINMFGCA